MTKIVTEYQGQIIDVQVIIYSDVLNPIVSGEDFDVWKENTPGK